MRAKYRSYPTDGLNAILILVIINFVIFFATLIRSELIYLLGFQPAAFFSRPWTVVTAMFVHAGFWHIFANMLTLYFFGSYFSRLVGRDKFLFVYFAGGIVGNLLFWALASPFAVAVGASGAVFALAGGLVMMLWDKRHNKVQTFSGGMKRRLELARGLLHHPRVLFLDEPTLGLDPQTRNRMWEYILGLSEMRLRRGAGVVNRSSL